MVSKQTVHKARPTKEVLIENVDLSPRWTGLIEGSRWLILFEIARFVSNFIVCSREQPDGYYYHGQ